MRALFRRLRAHFARKPMPMAIDLQAKPMQRREVLCDRDLQQADYLARLRRAGL